MMSETPAIPILLLEDSNPDAYLIERYLKKINQALNVELQVHRAHNKKEYYELLTKEYIKLIIADYKLDDILGDEALTYAKRNVPHIPFVFVTGTLNNEELAAQTILNGASGFVLKSNLPKLESLFPRILEEINDGEQLLRLDQEIKVLSQDLNTLYQNLSELRGQTDSTKRVERDAHINETLIHINHNLHSRQELIMQRSAIMEKLIYPGEFST